MQGCLAQAPRVNEENPVIDNSEFWEHHNSIIKELEEVTGKDYNKYSLAPVSGATYSYITKGIYRQKLGGLIARLHGEYFSDEPVPFAEMPSTIITQSQNQNQSVHVQCLLEVNDMINEKLTKADEGSKEKTFLEKIKGSLSSVRNVSQLVTLLLTTASKLGISIEDLKDLFN